MARNRGHSNQLCWRCRNLTSGCSWVNRFEPVKGWEAEKVEREHNGSGYHVYACPEFKPDVIMHDTFTLDLERWRKERCLSKEEVCAKIGIKPHLWDMYATDRIITASWPILETFAKPFKAAPEEFFYRGDKSLAEFGVKLRW